MRAHAADLRCCGDFSGDPSPGDCGGRNNGDTKEGEAFPIATAASAAAAAAVAAVAAAAAAFLAEWLLLAASASASGPPRDDCELAMGTSS